MGSAPATLAIIGASARAAAFSALNAGFHVTAADLFADADLASACPAARVNNYPAGLGPWLAAAPCQAWLYTGALENHPELLDHLATTRRLAGNSGEPLRRARDPWTVAALVAEAGLAFPDSRPTPDGLPHDGSWLCKTGRGASGSGVWRLDGSAARDRAIAERAFFQRYVEAPTMSAQFVVGRRQAWLAGLAEQWIGLAWGGPEPWRYVGSLGPRPTPQAIIDQLERLGEVLSHRLRLRGLVGVDLAVDGQRAWVLEINPRYTASVEIVEQCLGRSLVGEHVAACLDDDWQPPKFTAAFAPLAEPKQYAKAIFYAPRDAVVTPQFHRWALAAASVDPTVRRLADVPHPGETIAAGRPVLTAFGAGRGATTVSRLRALLAEVDSRLYGDDPGRDDAKPPRA